MRIRNLDKQLPSNALSDVACIDTGVTAAKPLSEGPTPSCPLRHPQDSALLNDHSIRV